ncbi:ComF family protein [Halorubrum sp. SS5]|jgi:predicted amidophosphoribosyltransferase|uniref:ComF family protein n=1 Tax=unclassified Halorubrum TaxID=2642239 RepID=UPI0010F555B7|nr:MULTISPECIES: ComF family protein [unclassified Halorubrum]TKX55564.1 ComF family protein [Halorubrum sp. SP3]TKX56319.1 ComF family protein [Halorubrum sp. SS7]TKX65616.1 ComF family protein [Halorubrum sp. SP9]TKX84461.1 ComF family protein [Halorubrum sp. SS5]
MTTYYSISDNTKSIGEFQGEDILHPKYQCNTCGHAISPFYAQKTGVCGLCQNGYNDFEQLERILSVTIYTYEFRDHEITNAIDEVKEGEHANEMADILEWGMENLNDLMSYDMLVPPPRGTQGTASNHMENIGGLLSDRVNIPLRDVLRKSEEYGSQRDTDGAQERWDNVDNKIECIREFGTSPSVIVLDDIATTGATLENCAKALNESGASKVVGLTIARTENIEDLVDAEVYIPEDEIPEDERP